MSNYYSILFYNAEIWLIPSLSRQAKTLLYSASANPLKMCCPFYDTSFSFERLHSITKRSPPDSIMKFNHALLLHKIYNSTEPNKDWTDIFSTSTSTREQILLAFLTPVNLSKEQICSVTDLCASTKKSHMIHLISLTQNSKHMLSGCS